MLSITTTHSELQITYTVKCAGNNHLLNNGNNVNYFVAVNCMLLQDCHTGISHTATW